MYGGHFLRENSGLLTVLVSTHNHCERDILNAFSPCQQEDQTLASARLAMGDPFESQFR